MNDADQGTVVVAQSMLAAVGDHRVKARWRTQLPVQPLPQWSPGFMLFQEPGGHRIGGEQQHVSIAKAALADVYPFVQWFAVRPGADQIRAHGELRRFLQGERRDHPHPFTDVIDLHEATVTDRQRRPPVRVSVNLETEKRRERALLGLLAGEPGEPPTRHSSPPKAARRLQPPKKLCPGELTAHIAFSQQHGPELGKTALGGAIGHRHAEAGRGASVPMRPCILVLLDTIARLGTAENLYVALVGRRDVVHRSGAQRRRTFAGRVPISRKWMTCNGCALKMNPREFSPAGKPSSVARATMNGVSVDEASNSALACSSGSLLALPGNSIDGPAVDERWMLKSSTEPSSPLTAVNFRASATRSPSVASPSVMLMTIGGNPCGCSWHHVSTNLVASLSAAHIGVPPFQ